MIDIELQKLCKRGMGVLEVLEVLGRYERRSAAIYFPFLAFQLPSFRSKSYGWLLPCSAYPGLGGILSIGVETMDGVRSAHHFNGSCCALRHDVGLVDKRFPLLVWPLDGPKAPG